jgi:hypothetical protein
MKARQARQARQDPRVPQENPARQAQKGLQESQESRERPVPRARLAPQDLVNGRASLFLKTMWPRTLITTLGWTATAR